MNSYLVIQISENGSWPTTKVLPYTVGDLPGVKNFLSQNQSTMGFEWTEDEDGNGVYVKRVDGEETTEWRYDIVEADSIEAAQMAAGRGA